MPLDPTPPLPPDTPLSKLPNFDPRTEPVVGVDRHLPAVEASALTPQALRARFASPPPWEVEVRVEPKFSDRLPAPASVLLPIVMRDEATLLLTERTTNLSTHSGQIAFPGGRADPEDADVAATALREAHEEIGLEARHVEVLGTLPTYTTGTRFVVTPVVALVAPGFSLQLNPYEVADAFEVPLAYLMDPAHHRRHATTWPGARREWFSMPWGPPGHERFIWGATAGMLRNLYRMLAAYHSGR